MPFTAKDCYVFNGAVQINSLYATFDIIKCRHQTVLFKVVYRPQQEKTIVIQKFKDRPPSKCINIKLFNLGEAAPMAYLYDKLPYNGLTLEEVTTCLRMFV